MALFGRSNGIEGLIKKIESRGYRGPAEKRQLLAELARQGEDLPTDVIVRFLAGNDAELGRFAIEQIERHRYTRLLDPLLAGLQRSPRSRWRPLILAIHSHGSPALPDRLTEMLRARRPETREVALEVIAADGRWRDRVDQLMVAVRDEQPALRVRAVRILGQDTRDATLRTHLRELMFDGDDVVRETAVEVLARQPQLDLIEDFFDILPGVSPRLQDEILRGLRRMLGTQETIPEPVLERILPLLAADDGRIREAAAGLLASVKDKLYVLRRFCHYAKGIAFWLRDRAFGAIANLSDDLTETILMLLEDPDLDVVVGAITMAGKSGSEPLLDGLERLLARDYDWWVKIPALEKLAEFPQPAVNRILRDKLADEELRTAALAALGKRAEAVSLQDILAFLVHEKRGVRRAALGALERYREPHLVEVLEQVARRDKDAECRVVALELLDTLGAEGVATAAAIREEFKSLEPDRAAGLTLEMLKPDLDA